jgi:hypothetical protein
VCASSDRGTAEHPEGRPERDRCRDRDEVAGREIDAGTAPPRGAATGTGIPRGEDRRVVRAARCDGTTGGATGPCREDVATARSRRPLIGTGPPGGTAGRRAARRGGHRSERWTPRREERRATRRETRRGPPQRSPANGPGPNRPDRQRRDPGAREGAGVPSRRCPVPRGAPAPARRRIGDDRGLGTHRGQLRRRGCPRSPHGPRCPRSGAVRCRRWRRCRRPRAPRPRSRG